MQRTKVLLFILLVGICSLVIFGSQYFNRAPVLSEYANTSEVEQEKLSIDVVGKSLSTSNDIRVSLPSGQLTKDKYLEIESNRAKNTVAKKQYGDDWCIANAELSENDYNFAKMQIDDWNTFQGKAKVERERSPYIDEFSHPNNSLVTSYSVLPLKKLTSLAIKGNKWAMVAFVQDDRAEQTMKNDIAKKLLVQGASYFALKQLVFSNMVAARTSTSSANATQEGIKHMSEAYAYAYWGLQQYNVAGISSFLASAANEPLKSKLPLGWFLVNAEQMIKERYKELKIWIEEERKKEGVIMPDIPKAVKNDFAFQLAIFLDTRKEEMDILSKFQVTDDNPLDSFPCASENLTFLKGKLEQ